MSTIRKIKMGVIKMNSNSKKKGYNVHQVRLYSITDELVSKNAFIDLEEAKQELFNYFKDEHYGKIYARGTIRAIEPNLEAWVVLFSVENPDALLFSNDEETVESWQVNYYDFSDFLIKSVKYDKPVPKKFIMISMLKMNAFYATVSCREMGNERYILADTYHNEAFNLTLIKDDAANARIKDESVPLEIRFKNLTEKDAEETRKILQKYKNRYED